MSIKIKRIVGMLSLEIEITQRVRNCSICDLVFLIRSCYRIYVIYLNNAHCRTTWQEQC